MIGKGPWVWVGVQARNRNPGEAEFLVLFGGVGSLDLNGNHPQTQGVISQNRFIQGLGTLGTGEGRGEWDIQDQKWVLE